MKTTIALFSVFLSFIGFSQSDIDNQSHPFQVIFAEEATYIGRQEQIKSFDFTNKYGLIRNKGKLILLHYTGYLFESGPGLIDIREIAEPLQVEGTFFRPPIDASTDPTAWKSEKQYHKIKLIYPWKHTIQLSRHERLPIQWTYVGDQSTSRKQEYEITVKDLHDRVLLKEKTKEDYYEIILDSLRLPENLIICHIAFPESGELSDDIVIAFEQEHQVQSILPKHYSITEYQSFIDGLIAIQKEQFDLATKLFHIAIDTHENPIFETMYRAMLKEHPELKKALED